MRGVRVEVRGTVQGVGFRPYVYRLASGYGLRGAVRNTGGCVLIEAAGPAPAVAAFLDRLPAEAPAASHIRDVAVTEIHPNGAIGFTVAPSTVDHRPDVREVPPDLATCPACQAELANPTDRRYRYPFLNCTDCGPRATIIDDLPYDRERTAMAGYRMCPECAAEYADPTDRRFHAEPVACPRCGPRLWWHPSGATAGAALAEAVHAIASGGVVAVKGVGGYQLVCDAGDATAVARIREAKRRPRKPLAVMVPDLDAARAIADVSSAEGELLMSRAAPIVLVGDRGDHPAVTGDLPEIGLFLPYSPVHHLLLAALRRPLVVTSGNRSGEPILVDDGPAVRVLGPLTDGVLGHDRQIRARYDDSVTRVLAGRPSVLRRARGYAPAPLPLPVPAPEPVLAVGAQLKHTATLAIGSRAVLGPHTGDLAHPAAYAAFTDGVDRLCRLHATEPQIVAHDLHPAYLSTQYAVRYPRRVAVQHHHAHVAAVAAEHGLAGPFLGVAYDGLGLGDDGTLWGGEILLAGYTGYRRLGRFGRAPLPGGEAAVRRPTRMALGYLYGGEDLGGIRPDPALAGNLVTRLGPGEATVVRRMVERRLNCPLASSAGRLFDAVAALLGVCDETTYEGEAAVLLEAAADGTPPVPALPWRLVRSDGLWVYDPAPTLAAVLTDQRPTGTVSAAFHATVAEVTCALLVVAAEETKVRDVCLGGGVFANRRLTTDLLDRLTRAGFAAYTGERVPVGDGGISYGQAVIAAARLSEE